MSPVWVLTFFKVSSFVFNRGKFHILVNYPFKANSEDVFCWELGHHLHTFSILTSGFFKSTQS